MQSGGFLIYLDLALIEAALRVEVEAVKQCTPILAINQQNICERKNKWT